MTEEERAPLQFLFAHPKKAFIFRFRRVMHRITLAGDRPRQQARLLTLIEWQAALRMAGGILCRRTQAIHMTVDKTTRNAQCACRL